MMYLAGQVLAMVGAAYLGGVAAADRNWWILVATLAVIVGVGMSVAGLKD